MLRVLLLVSFAFSLVASTAPTGHIDYCNSTMCVGWACDVDAPDTPLNVSVYTTYPDETFRVVFVADLERADVADACGGGTNHGFEFDLSPYIQPGRWTLNFYSPDLPGSTLTLIATMPWTGDGAMDFTLGTTVTDSVEPDIPFGFKFYDFPVNLNNSLFSQFIFVEATASTTAPAIFAVRPNVGPERDTEVEDQYNFETDTQDSRIFTMCLDPATNLKGYGYVGVGAAYNKSDYTLFVDTYYGDVDRRNSPVAGQLKNDRHFKVYYTDAATTSDQTRSIMVVSSDAMEITPIGGCDIDQQVWSSSGKTCYNLPTTGRSYYLVKTSVPTGSTYTVNVENAPCGGISSDAQSLTVMFVLSAAAMFFNLFM